MTTKPRTRGSVPFSMEDLLLIGHPGELLAGDLEEARAAAQWFVADPNQPESARQRVLTVWIEGTYMPAWDARPAPTVAATGSE